MKKIIFTLSLLLATLLPVTAEAASIGACSNSNLGGSTLCSDNTAAGASNPVYGSLKVILNIISTVAGVIAFIGLILIGARFITGGGNPDTYSKARTSLIYVIVGILVVALCQTIIAVVINKVKQ